MSQLWAISRGTVGILQSEGDTRRAGGTKQKASTANDEVRKESDSEYSVGLVVQHAMSSHSKKPDWIVDSGATCHMCMTA